MQERREEEEGKLRDGMGPTFNYLGVHLHMQWLQRCTSAHMSGGPWQRTKAGDSGTDQKGSQRSGEASEVNESLRQG